MWSAGVICNAREKLCHLAGTTTATIGLIACGYLLMSATTARPAAAQTSGEAEKGGWSAHVWPSGSMAYPADLAPPQYLGASDKKKSAEDTADPPRKVDSKEDPFRPGPQYEKKYDAKSQVDIYGAKKEVEPPRPPIELGRQQYTSGEYDKSSTILGELNPLLPGFAIYGDWRTAVTYNSNDG